MRVVITGSRHWTNRAQIIHRLIQLQNENYDLLVAHGASPGGGVDKFVAQDCHGLGIYVWPFPVRLGPNGPDGRWPYAGCLRNQRMLDNMEPHKVIAFKAEGKSSGTDDCLRRAKKMGVEDIEIISEISL